MRINILLESAETGERIYLTSKNRRNTPERLELKKYSPSCVGLQCSRRSSNYG